MLRVFTIVANEVIGLSATECTLMQFSYNPEQIHDPESVLRSAVMDYLKTDEGKRQLEINCGCWNWGDVDDIPGSLFLNYQQSTKAFRLSYHLQSAIRVDFPKKGRPTLFLRTKALSIQHSSAFFLRTWYNKGGKRHWKVLIPSDMPSTTKNLIWMPDARLCLAVLLLQLLL